MSDKTLREQLAEAFDVATAEAEGEEAARPEVEVTVETKPAEGEAPAEDDGTKAAEGAGDGKPAPAAEPTETPAAPENWDADGKAAFAKATPEMQKWMLDRHRQMEGDYGKKAQTLADERKQYAALESVIAPHRPQLQQLGISEAEGIRRLVAMQEWFQREPAAYAKFVIQAAKLTPEQIGLAAKPETIEESDDDFVLPEVKAVRAENAALQAKLAEVENNIDGRFRTWEQQQNEQRVSGFVKQVSDFGAETGKDGKPLRPYFNDVLPKMVALARAEREEGREPNLQALYDDAVWSVGSVRERLLASQREAAEAGRANKEKTAKAKAAAVSVPGSGQPGGPAPNAASDIRENLVRGFTEAGRI